jgi:hypothetical protein
VERVDGIEPTIPLWKRGVLPLNYTRGGKTIQERLPEVKPWPKRETEARRINLFSF